MKKDICKLIDQYYEKTKDIKKKMFNYGKESFCIFFQEELANVEDFEKFYLINLLGNKNISDLYPEICYEIVYKQNESFLNEIDKFIFYGNIILIKDNHTYRFNLLKNFSRSISDSISEAPNIMGPRDGFSDSCTFNTALLRTRMRSNCLEIKEYFIGRRSQTKVNMLYVKDITNNILVKKIESTMSKIDIDAVLSVSDLMTFFNRSRLFQTFTYAGSPDVVANSLLEGQVAIIIDRIAVCVILPISLFHCTKLRLDLEAPFYYVFFSRIIILFCFFMSVFFLGLMTCFFTYQQNNLSLIVLTTIKLTQKGALFPLNVEIMLIIFLFELYQLIGLRSANFSVQTIIVIIAGILIGQSTISGGLVSVLIMLVTAFAFICTYVVSNDLKIIMSLSIMRIIIFVSSLFLGLYGFCISCILLFSYIYSKRFMNLCFLYPIIPFDFKGVKDFFSTKNYYKNYFREDTLNIKDKTLKGKGKRK